MVGYLAVKEKPIAMIQPTEKDGWCAFRQPDGLCELHDRGLKPTEGVLASCKVVEEDDIPTYETSVLRAVAHEWVKVENFATIMRVVFKLLALSMNVENKINKIAKILKEKGAKHFGVHAFLASNTVTNEYYPKLARQLFELVVELRDKTGCDIQFINLSGGVGVPYTPDQTPNDIRVIGQGVKEGF